MRKLTVFDLMTLDGYIKGQGGAISRHNENRSQLCTLSNHVPEVPFPHDAHDE